MGFLDSWDFMVFLQRDAGRGQSEPDHALLPVEKKREPSRKGPVAQSIRQAEKAE